MRKDKWILIRDLIVRNCKIAFPMVLIFVAASTVVMALNAGKARVEAEEEVTQEGSTTEAGQSVEAEPSPEEVPLVVNEDPELDAFIKAYYTARGEGDEAGMLSAIDYISENDLLYYVELSKYIDHYADLQIYSKQGPESGTLIAYVYYKMGIVNFEEVPGYEAFYICRNEDGGFCIRSQGSFTKDEKEYIKAVNSQVDVVEFNNRVTVECTEVTSANAELAEYVSLLDSRVKMSVGEILAERNGGDAAEPEQESGTENPVLPAAADAQAVTGPRYGTATTTVNVRRSDSEKADKLGKVSKGTRLQVKDVQLNGWTKIVYEGKDGFIKSQYLLLEENVNGMETIGTVTATSTVNVRSAADQTSAKLGVLPKGESLELVASENGWCKVKYNGQVGYIKSDYVTRQ